MAGSGKFDMKSIKPGQLATNVICNHTFRFLANSAVSFAVTPDLLLGAIGTVCITSNSLVSSIAASTKINHIEMWAPPALVGGTSTVSVTWQSQQLGSGSKEVSDSSNSQAYPAHVRTRPPTNTLCSFWNQSSGTGLCTMVAPAGTVVDINLSFILHDDTSTNPKTFAVSAGSPGQVYYLALDGPAANNLRPLSLSSTS